MKKTKTPGLYVHQNGVYYLRREIPEALRSQLGVAADAWVMLTACRLVKKKGVDFLIGSMKAIRERIPTAQLMIVGSGREQKKLLRLVKSEGVEDCVTFVGPVRAFAGVPQLDTLNFDWLWVYSEE